MANQQPTPSTHFNIMPVKPKGTIEDYKAGNLPVAGTQQETADVARTVAIGKGRGPKRQNRAPKPAVPTSPPNLAAGMPSEATPYERVRADLLRKRANIDAALQALEDLYT